MILIIDDEEVVRETVIEILRFHGISVIGAADGSSGVAIYRAYQQDIALVMLDFLMRGLDSVRTRYELAQINPDVRVVLSSAYSEAQVMSRFAAMPVAGFIRKPYTAAALLDMVQSMLSIE